LDAWAKEGVVELMGWQDDMVPVLRDAHIVCLPSYGEGLPKALLEAASCGKPIVATNVPGCREIVEDGVNGLLVPARDAKALATSLRKLIEDAPLRERMGIRGREIVLDHFSIDAVAKATLAVYAELLGSALAAA
jgi:glycosyltransferase involved in cell wall biosynthesis